MTETSNTSMRIPTALREAAALAAKELKVAPSATALTTMALRATLEAAVMRAALDEYRRDVEARTFPADSESYHFSREIRELMAEPVELVE